MREKNPKKRPLSSFKIRAGYAGKINHVIRGLGL